MLQQPASGFFAVGQPEIGPAQQVARDPFWYAAQPERGAPRRAGREEFMEDDAEGLELGPQAIDLLDQPQRNAALLETVAAEMQEQELAVSEEVSVSLSAPSSGACSGLPTTVA